MTEQTFYKIVREKNNKYLSYLDRLPPELELKYKFNRITRPNIGFLFAFDMLECAIEYIEPAFDRYEIMRGVGEPAPEKETNWIYRKRLIPDLYTTEMREMGYTKDTRMEDLNRFWLKRRLIRGKNTLGTRGDRSMSMDINVVFLTWFKPVKIVTIEEIKAYDAEAEVI